MKAKQIAVVVGVLLLLGFGFNYFDSAKADALIAEERVRVLEAERVQLESEVEEANEAYEENVRILRDSLESYEGLGAILDTLRASHLREVAAYQDQVATLEADKALLWQRVEALDSMWVREQAVNQTLRNEIAAVHDESDAWRRAANPSFFRQLRGAVPYLLIGAGATTLLTGG